MRIAVLGSGSKGNCTYVEGSDSAILLDAGFSATETMRRLTIVNARPELIRGIIVTHEHADHIAGLLALARRLKATVYATEGTLACCLSRLEGHCEIAAIRMGERLCIGDFEVEPIPTSHDALEPCGYRVRSDSTWFGCYTDTGMVNPRITERLRACDALLLESNHCPEMLRDGPYPEVLKRRIGSKRGHLSNLKAAEILRELRSDVPLVMLAHLSEVNNNPARALACARSALGFYADEVALTAAPQHEVGGVIHL